MPKRGSVEQRWERGTDAVFLLAGVVLAAIGFARWWRRRPSTR
jgi:uncharacterized iron-regulated membrane protein